MKKLCILVAIVCFSCPMSGQKFYDMLKETIDSTFLYAKEHFKMDTEGLLKEYKLDYYYHPNSFYPETIMESKEKQHKRCVYIGDYDVMLGEDTIIINTYVKIMYKTLLKKRGLFRRIDEKKYYYVCTPNSLMYIYNKENNKWGQCNYKLSSRFLQWDNEVANGKRYTLTNCIDETLNFALNSYTSEHIVNSPNDILVIENTLGVIFFYRLYSTKGFPYLVASIQNLTSKDIAKYKAVFGWVDIELNGDIFKITIRRVGGKNYSSNMSLEKSLISEYICSFSYSPLKKSWVCIKKEKKRYRYEW